MPPLKPVRLPAAATNALPRWGLIALCLLYILPGLIARDPWKNVDAASFGIEWTMAHGTLDDWLWPHIANLTMPDEGPLAFWAGALCIKLFGWLLGDPLAARVASVGFFLLGSLSVWNTTFRLGCRAEAQPLRLAFGGQPEPKDYGRTLADGALLIFLGCLGLLYPIHAATAKALEIALISFSMYAAVKLFEDNTKAAAAKLGATFGLLVLTRGFIVPLALWAALAVLSILDDRLRATDLRKATWKRLLVISLPLMLAITGAWFAINALAHPFESSPIRAWTEWNFSLIDWPSFESVKYLFKNGIWFSWPAWPFAGWAVYAWRKQIRTLHIALPLTFFLAFIVLCLLDTNSEIGLLMRLIPPLAVLAAFGLPTMKRGAINAVDWFSVIILTLLAFAIWMYWISLQTGWPLPARNVLKLLPGFVPEFHVLPFLVALAATAGWFVVVHWRISRRPSVLWRAVVLSTGGGILCWLLLMTIWLPAINYARSYAGVASQIAAHLPATPYCVDAEVSADQMASFAYFGNIHFSQFDGARCSYLLIQERNRSRDEVVRIDASGEWQLEWNGRRPSDKDEHFLLYRRVN
jgi:4-amino-4-deoxy-L-arabinose transferase-like glycosyltransferase